MGILEEIDVFLSECQLTQDESNNLVFNGITGCFESKYLADWFVNQINFGWKLWRQAQAVPKWISVQDKLPEFQQEVLILVGDEYLVAEYLPSETNEFGIQFKEGFWINGGASVVDADLWMSLPQPPKAQEQSHD